jgi:predicted peroxiredoxin
MQGLILLIAGADRERFRSALEVAAANAALGRSTRLFLQSAAAPLLEAPEEPLLEEAIALGAGVTVCQSGLALAGVRADRLPEGVETGGLIELLSTATAHQIVMV